MAQNNVIVKGQNYQGVPAVNLPKQGGGVATFTDVTDTTAVASDVATGKYFYLANGTRVEGTGTGGGGGGVVKQKQINFIDYDGTILYAYTKAEINAMTSESDLPANPSHTGLTAQGWNWRLAQIKAQLTAVPSGVVNVGQMYTTSDGKTRLYIVIPEGANGEQLEFAVYFTQSVNNGVEVNWGDGTSAETYSGTTTTEHTHAYTTAGSYTIELNVVSGTVSFNGSSNYAIWGNNNAAYAFRRTRIVKAEIGNSVTTIGIYAFYYNYTLETITVPKTVTRVGSFAFQNCYSLKALVIPSGITSLENGTAQNDYSLSFIAIPYSVTSMGTSVVKSCTSMRSCTIPSGVTTISNNAFGSSYTITELCIPSSITTIGSGVLSYMYGIAAYHLYPTSPPSLASITNITTSKGIIYYVPYSADHSIISNYRSASGWSAIASERFVEEGTS
jgi:hypothetical protein